MARLEAIATVARRLVALVASAATALACSGGDGSNENPPVRVTIPVPAGSATHQLTAGTPSTSVHPVVLDPSIGVASATLDLAATLSHLDVTVSARAPRRSAAGDLGPATARAPEAPAAQVSLRVASVANEGTVCETGTLYGPFTLALGPTSLPASVSPAKVTASGDTVALLNGGLLVVCLEATYPVDASVTLNAVAVEYEEASCTASPADLSGTWTGTYQCSYSCGEPFGGDITLTVTQSGRDASYTDGDAAFTGKVCGNTFRFARDTGLEAEHGTMTLGPGGTAVKTSTYRAASEPFCHGECTDDLHRVTGGGGGSGPGPCPAPVARGCVDLLNFGASPVHVLGPGDAVGPGNLVPARTIVDTFIVPGRAHTTVAPTTAGTEVQFVARDGQGVQLDSATCTVGSFTWTEIPAEVVWQQTSDLTCSW